MIINPVQQFVLTDSLTAGVLMGFSIFFSIEDVRKRSLSRVLLNIAIILSAAIRVFWLIFNNIHASTIFEAIVAPFLLILTWIILRRDEYEYIGTGDIKYLLFVSLLISSSKLLHAVLAGSFLGIAGWYLIHKNRNAKQGIPFIPYLFAGSILSLCLDNPLYTFWETVFSVL